MIIELVQHGILLRGGITRGELYHQKNIAFGPAVIRAYELEQAAGTPRVILEPGLAEHAAWPVSMDEIEIDGFLNRALPGDADGWRYVDYFSHEHANEFDTGEAGLTKHYQMLWALVEKYGTSESPSILTKYGWVRAKLNQIKGPAN